MKMSKSSCDIHGGVCVPLGSICPLCHADVHEELAKANAEAKNLEAVVQVLAGICNHTKCDKCPLLRHSDCAGINCGNRLLKWAKREVIKQKAAKKGVAK